MPQDLTRGAQRKHSGPSEGRRRILALAGKTAIGVGLMIVLITRVDLGRVIDQLLSAEIWPLVASFLVFAASLLFHTWRWRTLLASRGSDLGFWETTRLIIGGNFLNLFLPGNLGGDVYRTVGARRRADSLLQSAGLVLIERYCGFLATFLMGFAAIAWSDFLQLYPALTLVFVALFVAFLLPLPLGGSRRLTRWAERLLGKLPFRRLDGLPTRASKGFAMFWREPGLIARIIVLSILMKVCSAVILMFLALSLDLAVQWSELFVFLPIHSVVSALPISLNGLGVREANLVTFFDQTGMVAEGATSLAFLHLIWIYLSALPGGLVLLCSPASDDPSSDGDAPPTPL